MFEGDGCVHYLDWGNGFTNMYICPDLHNCTFYINAVYCKYVSYIPIKLL